MLEFLVKYFQRLTGRHPKKLIERDLLTEFLVLLSPKLEKHSLKRYGSKSDGGYVIPDLNYSNVISCGIGDNLEFESELSRTNPQCRFVIVDGTIKHLPFHEINYFEWLPSLVRGFSQSSNNIVSLNDLLSKDHFGVQAGTLLKLDIEGFEYESLSALSTELLTRVDVLVVEFHNLFDLRFSSEYKWRFRPIFDRIFELFDLVWVNAHNGQGYTFTYGQLLPNLIEMTFSRKSGDNFYVNCKDVGDVDYLNLITVHDPNKPRILYHDHRFHIIGK